RRAGLDYHEYTQLQEYDDFNEFLDRVRPGRTLALSTRGRQRYDQARFADGDALVFGPETRGLPQAILDGLPPEQQLRLPMQPASRSLNLSNSAAVVVYEAWRQLGFGGGL